MPDIIRQMCSLGWEFDGHHPANVFLGTQFAGHHPANVHPITIGVDDYQKFGSNLYVYRGTSFFVSYLVRMLFSIYVHKNICLCWVS